MQLLSEDIKSIIMVNLMPSKVCAIGCGRRRHNYRRGCVDRNITRASKGSPRILDIWWLHLSEWFCTTHNFTLDRLESHVIGLKLNWIRQIYEIFFRVCKIFFNKNVRVLQDEFHFMTKNFVHKSHYCIVCSFKDGYKNGWEHQQKKNELRRLEAIFYGSVFNFAWNSNYLIQL